MQILENARHNSTGKYGTHHFGLNVGLFRKTVQHGRQVAFKSCWHQVSRCLGLSDKEERTRVEHNMKEDKMREASDIMNCFLMEIPYSTYHDGC